LLRMLSTQQTSKQQDSDLQEMTTSVEPA